MKRIALAILCLFVVVLAAAQVQAAIFTGDLFYTRFSGGPNVNRVTYTYDSSAPSFVLSNNTPIDNTNGADGIVFAPDGDLLVGGQGDRVHKVETNGSGHVTVNAGGTNSYHLAVDPSGNVVWSAGIPGGLASVPLAPFANGTAHALSGNDTVITSIAFDTAGNAYYTSSGPGGFGSFGKIDLTTFTTTRTMSNVPAAHGMAFDPVTGDLMLFGDSHISQIALSDLTILKSDRFFAGADFDQGTVDGLGHLFVASNDGDLFFMDYSASGLVADLGNFTKVQFLAESLDDIAPS